MLIILLEPQIFVITLKTLTHCDFVLQNNYEFWGNVEDCYTSSDLHQCHPHLAVEQ